jgi:hypothetical protein
MEAISSPQTVPAQTAPGQLSRVQHTVVVGGYVAVLLVSAGLVCARYLQYVIHRADVDASSGMWAFGDLLLELFIAGLFLMPTLVLAFFIRKSETAYTKYSQILFYISVTAPICIGAFFIPTVAQASSGVGSIIGWFCEGRVSASPVLFVGLVVSRILARFKRAKRLINYGLLIEVGTYVLLVAAVTLPWHRR